MPTSSQALILKTSDGLLHPVFGRPFWRPVNSWLDPKTRNDSIRNSFLFTKHPRRKQSPKRRAESTKGARLDFSELQELLQINGIHGSFIYDVNCNSLRVAIPTYQHRALKNLNNHSSVITSVDNFSKTTAFCADIPGNHVNIGFDPSVIHSKIARNRNSKAEFHKPAPIRSQEMVKLQVNDVGQLELAKVSAPEADYFRLMQDSEDGVFRLIKSDVKDAGSFRLESIKPTGIGDFSLVPKDGFESDDFRLVTLDFKNRRFRLLQADTVGGKTFHPVTITSQRNGNFHLIQAAPREKFTTTYRNNFASDNNAGMYEKGSAKTFEVENANYLPYDGSYAPISKIHNVDITEQTSVLAKDPESSASSFLPDITLYDSRNLTTNHRLRKLQNVDISTLPCFTKSNEEVYMYTCESSAMESADDSGQLTQPDDERPAFPPDEKVREVKYKGMTQLKPDTENIEGSRKLSWSSAENDMDAFREKYIESYRDASPEVYDRLVSLGFRPAKGNTEQSTSDKSVANEFMADFGTSVGFRRTTNKSIDFNEYHDIDWRTQNAKSRNHSTSAFKRADFSSALSSNEMAKLRSSKDRKSSLIDEVKLKANYKAWKKKKITALRMRKELPLKDPNAVCVTFRDNAISHERLKEIVERSAGSPLISLQFDPVSVHSIDVDAKSQWIFRFEDSSVCKRLVETGLWIDGEPLPVRKYDDVMKDEFDAYQYYLVLNEYRKVKQAKALEKDRKPRSTQRHGRKLHVSDSHTQTAGGTTLSQ